MAFTTGTAAHHNDLLDKLRLYLVAQGWTQLAWSAGATVNDESRLSIRGPGAGPGMQVFVNIRTSADAVAGFYTWELRGAVDYSAAAPWGGQMSESASGAFFNLWQNPIDYWFYVNDRRFVVVAKCSTNYMSCHAGFILPWGTPAEYPFPIYVVGDFHEKSTWSFNYSARRMFVDPGLWTSNQFGDPLANGYVRSPTGIWYPVGNQGRSSNTNYPTSYGKGQRAFSWPYHNGYGGHNGSGLNYNPESWAGNLAANDSAWAGESMVPTQQNERALFPVMLVPGDQAAFGVLDGVYAVGGTGLSTEQLITIGARNFRAFQNIQRNSPDDFFCVEEI